MIKKPFRNLGAAALAVFLGLGTTACKNFLDVNTNPNAPEHTDAVNYLAPMLHWVATSEQYDGRYVGRYSQMMTLDPDWSSTTNGPSTWDAHGYARTSDAAAQLYRDVYWNLGVNLSDMIRQSEAEERWDLAGVGYVLRAWGWLKLTDLHGDIIVTEAFKPDQYKFPFTPQDSVFMEIFRLLDVAITDLQRTDGKVDAAYLARGDKLFNGNTSRWLKYAYGLKAEALNQLCPNKTGGPLACNPQAVIDAVDKSFASNADDALFTYQNNTSQIGNTMNFWSLERQNLCAGDDYRQTVFTVGLMDGTQYPGAVDPRMSKMLSKDSTGVIHGEDPWVTGGVNVFTTAQRPWNLYGTFTGTGCPVTTLKGKYLFDKAVKFPIMTYSQLQFIKAEAALKKGDQATAKQAYLNGIGAHIDFVNARNAEIANPDYPQISGTDKANFLANPSIAPATITLSHIMGQKFIAQWMWAFAETWMDERRYHYTDIDPVSGTGVFRGFTLPPPEKYDPDNNQKPVQRIRARYNSDYVWNRDELAKIGGLALDYHTKKMWITEPGQ